MPKSRIPSPSRSQGTAATPRRERPRRSRSVASPTLSTASGRLTSVIDHFKEKNMKSFVLSPLSGRRSVLSDNTDIEEPKRRSWWNNLNESTRDIMEVQDDKVSDGNNAIEELFDIEVLSQEKKNYSLDVQESSGSESIKSIVVPQRKLFVQKEIQKKNIYRQFIITQESLPKHSTNTTNLEKTITAGTKELFKGTRRTKPVFPTDLLYSPNKTVATPKPETRNILGHRQAKKKTNMFTNFIASDSEDEIPEIQPKIFRFAKKSDKSMNPVDNAANATTDIDMDEWRHLPSSTMVEHQLEEGQTPIKRVRLENFQEEKPSDTIGNINQHSEHININPDDISQEVGLIEKDNGGDAIEDSKHAGQNHDDNENVDEKMNEDVEPNEKGTSNDAIADSEHNAGENHEDDENVDSEHDVDKNKDNVGENESADKISQDEEHNSDEIAVNEDSIEENNQVEEDNDDAEHEVDENEDHVGESASADKISQDEEHNSDEIAVNEDSIEENKQIEEDNDDAEHDVHKNVDHVGETESADEISQDEHNSDDIAVNEDSIEEINQIEEDIDDAEHDVDKTHHHVAENESADEISQDEEHNSGDIAVNEDSLEENNQVEDDSDDAERAFHSDEDEKDHDQIEIDEDHEQQESEELKYESDDEEENQESKNEIEVTPNITNDNTGNTNDEPKSPEAILHDMTNHANSFTTHGRNTSIGKTKSMIKSLLIRPSMAPARESTGMSDGTKNSSAEGSGWDSHRTTRKTLRQTFGKDFTLRKSLRALVMEKSAKRQTENIDIQSETVKFPQANSTELPDGNVVLEETVEETEEEIVEKTVEQSDDEVSRKERRAKLEMQMLKIRRENMERRLKIREEVLESLKAPPRDPLNLFRVPTRPAPHNPKQTLNKPKKQIKSAIPLGNLPAQVIEDFKYKPPKRFKPANASWITKRLYKFVESKLEPVYDYKARVRAERLVETIYNFTKQVRRKDEPQMEAIEELKYEMARINIVRTHFEFYEFFQQYMPREIRIKVVPDLVNNIPQPRGGVFADIIRQNEM